MSEPVAYLLDTHLLLWMASDSPRISGATRELITDPRTEVYFSVVSIWEVVIKSARPRSRLDVDATRLRAGALAIKLRELPVYAHHVLDVAALADLHADPFDRLLIAQARVEKLTLLTADATVLRYGEPVQEA